MRKHLDGLVKGLNVLQLFFHDCSLPGKLGNDMAKELCGKGAQEKNREKKERSGHNGTGAAEVYRL